MRDDRDRPESLFDNNPKMGDTNRQRGFKIMSEEIEKKTTINNENEKEEQQRTIVKKKLFLATFRKTLGSIQATCDKVGIERTGYYRWLRNDPQFALDINECLKQKLEDVEQQLNLGILKGESSLIRFFLERKHPEYKPHTVTEIITGSKSLKQLIDDDEETLNKRDDAGKQQSSQTDEQGDNRGSSSDQGQAGTNGEIQVEPGAEILLGEEDAPKPDTQGAPKGDQQDN